MSGHSGAIYFLARWSRHWVRIEHMVKTLVWDSACGRKATQHYTCTMNHGWVVSKRTARFFSPDNYDWSSVDWDQSYKFRSRKSKGILYEIGRYTTANFLRLLCVNHTSVEVGRVLLTRRPGKGVTDVIIRRGRASEIVADEKRRRFGFACISIRLTILAPRSEPTIFATTILEKTIVSDTLQACT